MKKQSGDSKNFIAPSTESHYTTLFFSALTTITVASPRSLIYAMQPFNKVQGIRTTLKSL